MTQPAQHWRAASALAEAATLIAVSGTAVEFSGLSQNGYESDKAIFVRVLALCAGAGWLGATAGRGRVSLRAIRGDPLVLLGIAVVISYAIASLLSIDRAASIFGSLTRQEGLLSRASYLIFFLVVADTLRSPVRRERMVAIMIVGSLPVLAYALLQTMGYDPLPSSGDPNTLYWPVRSTLGQHIFLGSYLVLVLPLTVAETWRNMQGKSVDSASGEDAWTPLVVLVCIPVSFVLFLELARNRPGYFALLPLLIGVYTVGGLVWSRLAQRTPGSRLVTAVYALIALCQCVVLAGTGARGAWLGALAGMTCLVLMLSVASRQPAVWRPLMGVAVVGGLFLIALNIPNGPLQPLRTERGLNRLANITDSGGAGGSGQGRLLIWQGVKNLMVHTPALGSNWGGPARWVVGYGPETLKFSFQRVYPLELRVVTSEIWTWDRSHNIFLDDLVDGGVLCLAAWLALFGLFLLRCVRQVLAGGGRDGALLAGGAAAIVGHMADGFFGLETPVTLLLLFVVVALGSRESDHAVDDEVAVVSPRAVGVPLAVLVVAALILGVGGGLDTHPRLLAAAWTAGLLVAVASVAGALGSDRIRGRVRLPDARFAGAALILALGLASAVDYQTAAYAERLGLADLGRGATQAAIDELQTAANAYSFEPQFETDLASAYLSMAASNSRTSGPLISESAASARTLASRVRAQLSQAQLLQLSLASILSAQQLAPLDPDNAYNAGNVLLQAGQPDAALAQYALAARLSNQNPRYLDQAALAWLQRGNLIRARTYAANALAMDATFWYSHYVTAIVADHRGARGTARAQALLALYWMKNYWPAPPTAQVQQVHQLAQGG